MCGRNLIRRLTSAASPRVDISNACKRLGQKYGVSLPLLTCSPSAWPPRLLYRRSQRSRRDLWITLYIYIYIYIYIYLYYKIRWFLLHKESPALVVISVIGIMLFARVSIMWTLGVWTVISDERAFHYVHQILFKMCILADRIKDFCFLVYMFHHLLWNYVLSTILLCDTHRHDTESLFHLLKSHVYNWCHFCLLSRIVYVAVLQRHTACRTVTFQDTVHHVNS